MISQPQYKASTQRAPVELFHTRHERKTECEDEAGVGNRDHRAGIAELQRKREQKDVAAREQPCTMYVG
jgi:hypothetical protein